jgi:hypothetical protein
MKRYLHVQLMIMCTILIFGVGGCSKDDPRPSDEGGASELTFSMDNKNVKMYSVADEIWTNQDDLSSQIKLYFVIDPSFKDKKTNNSISLGISRIDAPGTFLLGGDGDNSVVLVENGMENMGSYETFWESTSGKIEITEFTDFKIKGTFSGTLVKKKNQGLSIVTIPGSDIQIEKGQFTTNL